MPTTAPAISTKTRTRVIPFLRSKFSPKEVAGIKKKADQKDDSKYNWKYIPYSIGNISHRIFDPADLRKK